MLSKLETYNVQKPAKKVLEEIELLSRESMPNGMVILPQWKM